MATRYLEIWATNDFVTGKQPPPETGSGGTAGGSAPFELEVAPGGTWVRVAVTDDDAIFDEVETGQSGAGGGDQQVLAEDVTIGGVTYTAGMRIVSAYDLINSSTGHKVTSIHIGTGVDGFTTGAVVGVASTEPLDPGVTYTFNQNRTSNRKNNLYTEYVCFAGGTSILTPTGYRLIEEIEPGDLVLTRDRGAQPVLWHGAREVNDAPVIIRAGTLGARVDVWVSPQHRLLIASPQGELLFWEAEVLVSARHAVDGHRIVQAALGPVTYHHLLLEQHEILTADGVLSESFHPGQWGVSRLDA
ncbi:MAG: Hint domain-containing protein, partial [Pseudomonadota bacterium]